MTDRQSVQVDRRAELLEAARALFRVRGFNHTPVSAIVREAGVSQGTFYLYFQSKQALLATLRRELFASYANTLTRVASLPGPADERLSHVVVAMAGVVAANVELERMFRFAEAGEDAHRATREGWARLAELACALLERGADEASFADRPHRLRTATLIVALFDSLLFDVVAFEPEALAVQLETSLCFVLGGLGVHPDRIAELVARIPEFREPLADTLLE